MGGSLTFLIYKEILLKEKRNDNKIKINYAYVYERSFFVANGEG